MRLKPLVIWMLPDGVFIHSRERGRAEGRKGEWSVWVSGNWRVTFRFDGNNATDVNYEDYH